MKRTACTALVATMAGVLVGTPAEAAPRAASRTAFVYATREGLVGHTTANGHVIVASDHFVSLPSWHSLSRSGTGDYSVRVCSAVSGRCAYEPVWDVGPWNTRDDYWDSPRQQWTGLPPGRPEAQAAYQDAYNGGRDQYGRLVRNPAGLDLADGAINDDLALPGGSAWVTVTFLWTGPGTQGQVRTAGGVLSVRGGPSRSAALVGAAAPTARLPLACSVHGQTITGYLRTTDVWLRIGVGNYVSYAYVAVDAGVSLPHC